MEKRWKKIHQKDLDPFFSGVQVGARGRSAVDCFCPLFNVLFSMLLGMLDAQLNALVTIAGTGGVGFAGDGGLGRLALLRHPEGLALKPNMASGSQEAPPI